MFTNKERNLNEVLHFLKDDQKLRLKDLLMDFNKEGLQDLGYLPNFNLEDICKSIDLSVKFQDQKNQAEEAAKNGKTTIPVDRWGVHETHCCKDHGCKYGYVDCPVALDLIQQKYPCEWCNEVEQLEQNG